MRDVPIAVVGLACRFPGANDADTYWENILKDVYSIAPLPPERFHEARYFDPEIGAYGKSYCMLGGLVDPPTFDPAAFRMPPKVVASTDEAHLWALDVARCTFEDAGYDLAAIEGANIGVVIGHARGSMLTSDMGFATAVEGMLPALRDVPALRELSLPELERRVVRAIHDRYPKRTEDGGTGTMTSALAGLITNTFGLTGRHMVVDAACASSFAALDIGISGLTQGRLDAALVGGASYSQEMSVVMFAQSRALSPDGSYPFDQRANGFISSDGFGLVLLKRLDDALANGDRIRAVIRGVAGSCDGKGKALWAPRKEGQTLAMARAYRIAGVDPASIGLIEGHATSTPLGDRTELEALHEFFRSNGGPSAPLPIGSVKGNIGHAREAAGAAGLIKAILALEHATLPPTGNFRTASSEIPWQDLAVEVITAPRPWKSDGVRRAGVDAFGIGGLNYHVIVEEAPRARPQVPVTAAVEPARADIAIVGIGGKFPRANTVSRFWENLIDARDLASPVPPDRWDRAIYYAPGDRQHYRTYLDQGAFITDFEPDWRRYKVPPKLIERNDPLQFMILESALDAFADAGIDVEQIDRERVSVIVGSVFGSDYALELSLAIRALELAETVVTEAGRQDDTALFDQVLAALRSRFPSINEDSSGSFSSSTLASRTAKTLDLMGPAYAIDAACASSLASLEAGCELLRNGTVDLVAYAGADRGMRVQRYEAYCQFYALTKGQPRPFDRNADGFLPGEGAAVCILKRLEDAERDGDHVYAVIKGVGSSGNGTRGGLHKPSALGLSTAMRRAVAQARIDRDEVRFIECHGGATPLGDRTEVESIREAYGEEAPRLLGSVKSNVGHTQGAAGVIALVKTALAIDRGEVPPTRGFEEPHPDHRFGEQLRVNQVREALQPGRSGLLAAGVSSMGLAGVNYHAVLQSHPRLTGRAEKRSTVFRISDLSRQALQARLAATDPHALHAEERIGEGAHVVSVAALDERDLESALSTLAKAGLAEGADEFRRKQGIFYFEGRPRGATSICFAFSGQGSQYAGMMKAFAETLPPVKRIVDRFDVWLTENGRAPLSKILFSGEPIPSDVFLVQAAVLAGDLMAFEALRSIGLSPAFVTGHSFGDYAALVAAGCWSLEDALRATDLRARAIEASAEPGGMTSVTASKQQVGPVLRDAGEAGYVAAANVNAPDQVVIAGTIAALERAEAAFAKQRIETQRLPIPRAFHSALMEGAKATLAAGLKTIAIGAPKVRYLSSITGRFEDDPEQIRRALIDQLTLPVDFVAQVKTLAAEGATVFVECGPRGVLTGLVKRIAPELDALSTDDANRPGRWSLARVEALLDARAAALAAEAPAETSLAPAGPALALFEGELAEALLAREGFRGFWERTRPSIANMVQSLFDAEHPAPEEVVLEAPTAVPATATATNVASRADVEAFVLKALCEQSGYPPEIITLDADLEADLGIDTVKQAQVLGKVRDQFDLRTDEKLSLRDFPTLRHVLEYVDGQLQVVRTTAPRRSLVPIVDVTERRTQRPEPAPPAPDRAAPAPTAAPAPRQASLRIEIPAPRIRLPKDTARPVTVLHLHGTSREIGRQHGDALRDPILEVMHEYLSFVGDQGIDLLTHPDTLPRLHGLFDAPSIEEIEGVAEAIGVPYVYLLAYNLDAALFPVFAGGCTQSVRMAKDNGGSMIHLVNEDSPLLLHLGGVHPRVVQIRRRTDGPQPERRTVFFSLSGQIVGPNAVSDTGLTVTSTTLLDGRDPEQLPEGLPHPQIVKRIAEEARSLDEAMQIARDARRAGRWSLLVSDMRADRACYLEYDAERILTDEEIERTVVTTNHSICEPAAGCSVPEHSAHREARARTLLSEASVLTVERAQAILRDRHDAGRGREVPHPTMNTVRRVDNVMSLVVDPSAGELWVTDRVQGAGTGESDAASFMKIAYAPRREERSWNPPAGEVPEIRTRSVAPRSELMARTEPVARFTSSGAGLAGLEEVMRRYVIRAVAEEAPAPREKWRPRRCLIAGDGPFAAAIASAIGARGVEVRVEPNCQGALRVLEGFRPDALGIVLAPSETPAWELNVAAWRERRESAVSSPFRLLRAFRGRGSVFGVTFLGGALGFENTAQCAGEQGALLGLLKAVRRELGVQVQALDLSPSETPEVAADVLLGELDAGSPRLEVGLLRKKRMRLVLAERPAGPGDGPPLPRRWLVTGGARGITAKMCIRLAELCQPDLHLVGRHRLPPSRELAQLRALDAAGLAAEKQALLERMKSAGPSFTPLAWKNACEAIDKSLEIDANLEAMRAAGSEVHYHVADVADREAMRALLAAAGPLEGLLHGAGVEVAKPLDKKTDGLFEQTVSPKIDGLVNLLALTRERPFSRIVAFGSVSGRFGGHGQADYSLANEGLSRLLQQARRVIGGQVTVIDWAAFSEVGLAARSSAKTFLERSGQAFMTPAEGANHLVRELWSDGREGEVVISERMEALDLDRLMIPEPERLGWLSAASSCAASPMLQTLILDGERTVAERTLSASEPFLDQHRMGATPILPAVIGLELMAELAALRAPASSLAEVRIEQPLKVPEGARVVVRVERSGDAVRVVSTPVRPDGVVLEPDRVFVRGRLVPAAPPVAKERGRPSELLPYPYPSAIDRTPGSRAIFHGPVFRCLQGVAAVEGGGIGRLLVPSPTSLVPGSRVERWRIPAALLDGCLQAVGLLGRLAYSAIALPAGFGRVDVAPRALEAAGEEVQLVIEFREVTREVLVADFSVMAADGPLLSVTGYRAQVVPDT